MPDPRPHAPRTLAATLPAVLLVAACGATAQAPPPETTPPAATPVSEAPASEASTVERAARADSLRDAHTAADVAFIRGMIHHHAQAVEMALMVPDRDPSPELRTLAARIINSQKDEIALMQDWLRERGEPVPRVSPEGRMEGGHAMGHMPGMLTAEQMAELEAARGFEFDLLFLSYMIQHHQGALVMVDELFGTYGSGQGEAIFRLASDIGADQTADIERMRILLRDRMVDSADSP